MKIKRFNDKLSICQLRSLSEVHLDQPMTFLSKTPDEISLVCRTENVPPAVLHREDNWRIFRIEGQLDFSLIGILANIAGILAKEKISIFAASTFDTDYILVKANNYETALNVLAQQGYDIID